MKKKVNKMSYVAALLGVGSLAVGLGYLLGRGVIRWQDRNDPPVTAINE